MAIRIIRQDGDEILRKKSREVVFPNTNIETLLSDMADTMYHSNGIGLAAPQVGILKRAVVIDIGEGVIQLVNPVITKKEGEQSYIEGCLSIPGIYGEVNRPAAVTVEAYDAKGKKQVIKGEGLLAVALCHELDHLDGVLFKDKAVRFIDKDELKDEEE